QVDRGLRAIHSLKGDAGFLGFITLRSLAHAMENLLEHYRDSSGAPPVPVIEALLSACDRLLALVEDLEHSHTADIAESLELLAAAAPKYSITPIDIDIDLRDYSRIAG